MKLITFLSCLRRSSYSFDPFIPFWVTSSVAIHVARKRSLPRITRELCMCRYSITSVCSGALVVAHAYRRVELGSYILNAGIMYTHSIRLIQNSFLAQRALNMHKIHVRW